MLSCLWSKAKLIKLNFIILFYSTIGIGQNSSTFYLGHSLINFQIPQMVSELASDAGTPMSYKANIGNGANLGWHWTQPHTGQGDRWDQTLNNFHFDNFILTEAIPLKGQIKWSDTYSYVDKFYKFALNKSPDIQLYIYETWHCIDSGTPIGCEWDDDSSIPWRERLDKDLSLWESIADEHNKINNKKALIIPGGQGLARLHDAIYASKLPGFTSHRQLFSDNIHLTSIGNYFIACIMYSVIFKKSPEGLTNQLKDPYGQTYMPYPTQQQASIMQKIAWETVCNYKKHSNVNCTTNAVENSSNDQNLQFFYPNLIVNNDQKPAQIKIYNILGNLILHKTIEDCYNLDFLGTGIYFIQSENQKTIKILIH